MKQIKTVAVAWAVCTLLLAGCSSAKKTAADSQSLNRKSLQGTWELNLIPLPTAGFNEVYPGKKPEITFDIAGNVFTGNTSCNTFNGKLIADDSTMSFKETMAMTRMACDGDGEEIFLKNLTKINRYAVSRDGKELTMIQGDVALMRFHKK